VSITKAFARRLFNAVAPRVAPRWYRRRATLIGARDWDMVAEPDEQYYASQYLAHLRHALATAPGRRVVDLGCGQGRIAIPLAREGYAVSAVDWSSEALAAARRYADGGSAPVFHEADVLDWLRRAPDASTDAVLALELLYMHDGWRDLVQESTRVLAPGGLAAFGFRPLLYYLRYHARRREYALMRRVSEMREGPLGALRFNWHTTAEVVTLLEKAGFADVTCIGIGILSGLAGDPFDHVARPSALTGAERDTLAEIEARWGEIYPDDGRYILALARR
jgi:SAM-dependent methyltransferase